MLDLVQEPGALGLEGLQGAFSASDGEEGVAVVFHIHGERPGEEEIACVHEESDEVHPVFEGWILGLFTCGFEELSMGGQRVAGVALIGEPRDEVRAERAELMTQGCGVLDNGGEEDLEGLGFGLEGELEEALELPVLGVEGGVLKGVGYAVEGPVPSGGGEEDAAAVDIRAWMGQAIRVGADDGGEDDVVEQRRELGGGELEVVFDGGELSDGEGVSVARGELNLSGGFCSGENAGESPSGMRWGGGEENDLGTGRE